MLTHITVNALGKKWNKNRAPFSTSVFAWKYGRASGQFFEAQNKKNGRLYYISVYHSTLLPPPVPPCLRPPAVQSTGWPPPGPTNATSRTTHWLAPTRTHQCHQPYNPLAGPHPDPPMPPATQPTGWPPPGPTYATALLFHAGMSVTVTPQATRSLARCGGTVTGRSPGPPGPCAGAGRLSLGWAGRCLGP